MRIQKDSTFPKAVSRYRSLVSRTCWSVKHCAAPWTPRLVIPLSKVTVAPEIMGCGPRAIRPTSCTKFPSSSRNEVNSRVCLFDGAPEEMRYRIRTRNLLSGGQRNLLREQTCRIGGRAADDDQVVQGKILDQPICRQNPDHTRRVIGFDLPVDREQCVEVGVPGVAGVVQVGGPSVRRRLNRVGAHDADRDRVREVPERAARPLGRGEGTRRLRVRSRSSTSSS